MVVFYNTVLWQGKSRTFRKEVEERTGQLLSMTANLNCLKLLVKPQLESLGISREKHFSIFRLNDIATPVYLSSAATQYCYI